MQDDTIKVISAIFGIVLIEIAAILNGIDGVLLTAVIAVLAGLGGYEINNVVSRKYREVKNYD